jgi:hypothetical protein
MPMEERTMIARTTASPRCPICTSVAALTHKHPDAGIFKCPECGCGTGSLLQSAVALTGTDVFAPAIPDFEFILRRLKSIAAPRALIIVMTINEDSVLYMAARALRAVGIAAPFDRLYSPHHVHHFSRKSLARLFAEEGITIEQTILHNSALKSVDIPVSGVVAGGVLKAAVGGLFLSGSALGKTYLQTLIMRAGR